MTMIARFLSLVLLAIALVGAASPGARAQEAEGDWRAEQKVLRIGILASGGAERRLAAVRPFEAYMSKAIGLPVELVPLRDMRVLIDAIVNARIDYAPLSASAYAAGWTLCRCLEPLAAPLAGDETPGFHAIVVTRADSGLRRLADLKDKALVYSDTASVAGYLVPRAAFRAEGIEDETFFGRIGHAPGPVAAVTAMLDGDYDAALAWSSLDGDAASGYSRGTLHAMIADGRLSMDDIRIVWQSRLIPHGPHVVRVKLAEELKTLLRAALFDLAETDPDAYDAIEPAFSGGFAAVSADSYAPLVQIFAR